MWILFLLVSLLLIPPASSLAVRAVPIEQHDQRHEEDAIGDRDARHHIGYALGKAVALQHNPRVGSGWSGNVFPFKQHFNYSVLDR